MPFAIGDRVRKVTGRYHPPGEIRGSFTTKAGDVRVVVEHDHGMCHIYAPEQLAAEPLTKSAATLVRDTIGEMRIEPGMARLALEIAARAVERGRHLTSSEKLANLQTALAEVEDQDGTELAIVET